MAHRQRKLWCEALKYCKRESINAVLEFHLFICIFVCLFFCVGKNRGAGLSVLVELRKAGEVVYYLAFNGQMGQCCLSQYISFPSEKEKSNSEHLFGI
jgi:hypothetical protein